MSLNIDATYEFIQKELQKGHRGLVSLKNDEISDLINSKPSELKKVLFILSHASHAHLIFAPFISNALNSNNLDSASTLFALQAFSNHVIKAHQKEGMLIPPQYLNLLKTFIKHSSPDVVEWTLRLIEECGVQGVMFKKDLEKIKPPVWKLFFKTQRNIRELIEFLERRWHRYG